MSRRQQKVFLALSRPELGNPVDGQIIGFACSENGLSLVDWDDAFEQTRFGAVRNYGSYQDLQIDIGAYEFLQSKFNDLATEEMEEISQQALKLVRRYKEILKTKGFELSDRRVEAFRTSEAKVAYLKVRKGDFEDAVLWFEEAVKRDPANSALWDRFAWYLMVNGYDLDRAFECSKQACVLSTEDSEAHFTAGMVAARLGRINQADELLTRAASLGKEVHLCLLQRARARLDRAHHVLKKDIDHKELGEAHSLICDARRIRDDQRGSERLARKHLKECDRLKRDLDSLFAETRREGGD